MALERELMMKGLLSSNENDNDDDNDNDNDDDDDDNDIDGVLNRKCTVGLTKERSPLTLLGQDTKHTTILSKS